MISYRDAMDIAKDDQISNSQLVADNKCASAQVTIQFLCQDGLVLKACFIPCLFLPEEQE